MVERTVRLAVVGIGNLGARFVRIVAETAPRLLERWSLVLQVVAVADRGGCAVDPGGLDAGAIIRAKREGRSVASLPCGGRPGQSALEMIREESFDVLCEATPVRWEHGAEPGLSHVRAALSRGRHVVTPNKGPITRAGGELIRLAAAHGAQLRYDGTVAGGLPVLYTGTRDLRGAEIRCIEAVPNLSTGVVLDLLGDGVPWDEAVDAARQQGALEEDPDWDLEGWDAAAKLVILARAVQGADVAMDDVDRRGIRDVSAADVIAAQREGERVRLVATSEATGDSFRLRVAPSRIDRDHPLAGLGSNGMGIVFTTDLYGVIS
ncbi:MAG: homoserine dehydrogenase, partial [Candidatus Bipolaricaulota bacterium]